jgi:hypothetical protein
MAVTFTAESTGQSVSQVGARIKVPASNPKVKILAGRITFDSSYPTGGEPVNDSEATAKSIFGLNQVLCVIVSNMYTTSTGAVTHLAGWSRATGKILTYTALGTETTAATDLSTKSVDCIVVGY